MPPVRGIPHCCALFIDLFCWQDSLPPLTSAAVVLQLNSRQLDEYHEGYLEKAPPQSIEAKRINILRAIGSPHLCAM